MGALKPSPRRRFSRGNSLTQSNSLNYCVKLDELLRQTCHFAKIVCLFLAIRHFMLYLCRQFCEGVMKRILLSLFFLLTWVGSATLADTPVTNGQGQQQTLTETLIEWNATFQIYLKEVEQSSFSETQFIGFSDKDLVYQGVLSGTSDTMPIVFDKSYYYQGGNLLVGFYQITKGNSARAVFHAKAKPNASIYGKKSASFDQ